MFNSNTSISLLPLLIRAADPKLDGPGCPGGLACPLLGDDDPWAVEDTP